VPIFDLLNSANFMTQLEMINTKLDTVNTNLVNVYDRLHDVYIDEYVNVRLMDITGELPVPCSEVTGLLVSAYASGPPAPTHVIVDSGNVDVSGTPDNPIYVTSTPFDPFLVTTIVNPVYVRTDGLSPFNVIVTNTPNVVVSNTPLPITIPGFPNPLPVSISTLPPITGTVDVHPYMKNAENGVWEAQLGFHPSKVGYISAAGANIFGIEGGAGILPMTLSTGFLNASPGTDKNAWVCSANQSVSGTFYYSLYGTPISTLEYDVVEDGKSE
jgi:hypothetical protein